MIVEILLGIMIISMVIVLLASWKWFGSLRLAFIIMLIIGKVWAGVLYAFGIDKPLFNILVYNKIKGAYATFTVTATQFIFLSFLGTLLVTLLWPYIQPYIPEPIRRVEVIRE